MMQQYTSNSYLFGGNAPYVEELYEAYLNNPGSVPDNWRAYFDAMQHVPAVDGSNKPDVAHAPSSPRSPSAPKQARSAP
jgi:2-oxoglutarate dehydrogenase E1 component